VVLGSKFGKCLWFLAVVTANYLGKVTDLIKTIRIIGLICRSQFQSLSDCCRS
jgi:hypothetical protein